MLMTKNIEEQDLEEGEGRRGVLRDQIWKVKLKGEGAGDEVTSELAGMIENQEEKNEW